MYLEKGERGAADKRRASEEVAFIAVLPCFRFRVRAREIIGRAAIRRRWVAPGRATCRASADFFSRRGLPRGFRRALIFAGIAREVEDRRESGARHTFEEGIFGVDV